MNNKSASAVAVVLMSAWLGAAALTSASVAPAAFAELPDRTLAGEVVGRVLAVVFISGILTSVAGVLLVRPAPRSTRAALIVTAVACFIAQFLVTPRLEDIRASIGGTVQAVPSQDAWRQAFGRLHMLSVTLLGIAMISAFIFVILSLRTPQRSPESANG